MEFFTLTLSKWLAAKLRQPSPMATAKLLPAYAFRHKDFDDPRLVSLAYLIEPCMVPGKPGWNEVENPSAVAVDTDDDGQNSSLADTKYESSVIRLVGRCKMLKDLDEIVEADTALFDQLANETKELLVGCGYDQSEVDELYPNQQMIKRKAPVEGPHKQRNLNLDLPTTD